MRNAWIILLFPLLIIGCGQGQTGTTTTTMTTTTRPATYWTGRSVISAETFSAQIIYCSGNLSIESGGRLTLNNSDLYISCESDAQFGIFVKSGGTMAITNESLVSSFNTTKGYSFWYQAGSAGSIYSSTIEAAWTPSTESRSFNNQAGLFVEAADFLMIGATIKNSKGNGLETFNAARFQARNANFINNGASGLLVRNSPGVSLEGNSFSNNSGSGLYLEGTAEVFAHNNTISGNNIGVTIFNNAQASTFEANTIKNNTTWGISLDNASSRFYYNIVTGNNRAANLTQTYGLPQPNFGDLNINRTGYNDLSGNTNGVVNNTTSSIKAENNFWDFYSLGAIANYNNDLESRIDAAPYLISAP